MKVNFDVKKTQITKWQVRAVLVILKTKDNGLPSSHTIMTHWKSWILQTVQL